MMTQQLEVSILAAPLAAIDRRAISQAWYSALRLATPSQLAAALPASIRAESVPPRERSQHDPSVSPRHSRLESMTSQRVRPQARAIRAADEPGRLKPRSIAPPLAARIERAFAESGTRLQRATFSLGRGNARVHVILKVRDDCVMLVALCTPELRGVVGSALTQARLALAARRIALAPRQTGGVACS